MYADLAPLLPGVGHTRGPAWHVVGTRHALPSAWVDRGPGGPRSHPRGLGPLLLCCHSAYTQEKRREICDHFPMFISNLTCLFKKYLYVLYSSYLLENTFLFYVKMKIDKAKSDKGLFNYLCDFSINLKLLSRSLFLRSR